VLGDGKLDLPVAMVLNAHGYRVHQLGRHAAKLAIAARAGVVTQMATEMATEIANGALPIAAYDWVVDATGSPEGLRSAAMTRPRGTVILKSTVHGTVAVSCEGDRPRRIDRDRHAPGARVCTPTTGSAGGGIFVVNGDGKLLPAVVPAL